MSEIAFLGLGAMGSRMAARLLAAGHRLTVWNRSPAALETLVAQGARAAATPREAASGAEFVIAMVRDDQASRQVWCDPQHGALAGMAADAIAIESSTLSVDGIKALAAMAQAQGVALLEAPVSGSRPQAQNGQLVYLVGGDAATLARADGVLRAMGAAVHHVGPVGAGTVTKLATNALLGLQVAALAEITGLFARNHVDANAALSAISATSVWAPVNNYLAGTMLRDDFQPQFPVALIEKDFRYALQAVGGAEHAPTLAAARGVFEAGIARGLGDENMTAVAKLFR
jgi:3-hydroxyisobutyrate dehydrogenase